MYLHESSINYHHVSNHMKCFSHYKNQIKSHTGHHRSYRHNVIVNLLILSLVFFIVKLNTVCGLIKQPDQFKPFNGIPAAFGDLNSDKRTDIVVISGDGHTLNIYFQQQKQPVFDRGFSCKCDSRIAQVYLADTGNDGYANVLPLLESKDAKGQLQYELVNLQIRPLSSATMAALESSPPLESSGASNLSSDLNSTATAEALRRPKVPVKEPEPDPEPCKYDFIDVKMKRQPLLFDLEGDLQTDFMSVDTESDRVTVWRPPNSSSRKSDFNNKNSSHGEKRMKTNGGEFDKMDWKRWSFIDPVFFNAPHSHSFIDMNHDAAADIVFSSQQYIMYAYAEPNVDTTFTNIHNFTSILEDLAKIYDFGQSSLVDINADGVIDHVIPRCRRPPDSRTCEIVVLHNNGFIETIYKFKNDTNEFTLDPIKIGPHYEFPVTLRSGDLDGDGFTDFVAIVRGSHTNKNQIVWLHNVDQTKQQQQQNFQNQNISTSPTVSSSGKYSRSIDNNNYVSSKISASSISRTFEMKPVPFDGAISPEDQVKLVILFDINEDGKVDMLIGSSERDDQPQDLRVTARMNSQMVDACFMKVLVTNGYCGSGGDEATGIGSNSDSDGQSSESCSTSVSNGQSARGPFICFELSQNDGKVRKGCAGQLAQSSHFALQAPYVIFGLGQTPHFVETLNVSIPGYGKDGNVRTRVFEQIVPDAQVIIIPNPKEYPNNWDYKLFLSPMSDLVLSTLITLAVICLVILLIICILHRKESLEDLAEHEEYKRHWPESR